MRYENTTRTEIEHAFMRAMHSEHWKFSVVLPSGECLSVVCAQTPSVIIEPFLLRKFARRNYLFCCPRPTWQVTGTVSHATGTVSQLDRHSMPSRPADAGLAQWPLK